MKGTQERRFGAFGTVTSPTFEVLPEVKGVRFGLDCPQAQSKACSKRAQASAAIHSPASLPDRTATLEMLCSSLL